jgi:hypothetical protein
MELQLRRGVSQIHTTLFVLLQEDDDKETYHACCITAVHDEDGNRSVHVFDPSNQESECVL